MIRIVNALFLALAAAGTLLMLGGTVPTIQSGIGHGYHLHPGFHWPCLTLDPAAAGCPGTWRRGWEPP